jgi:hypothetical protein
VVERNFETIKQAEDWITEKFPPVLTHFTVFSVEETWRSVQYRDSILKKCYVTKRARFSEYYGSKQSQDSRVKQLPLWIFPCTSMSEARHVMWAVLMHLVREKLWNLPGNPPERFPIQLSPTLREDLDRFKKRNFWTLKIEGSDLPSRQ